MTGLGEKPALLTNRNLALLASYLNNIPVMKEPVVNETGYTGSLDLKTEGGSTDLPSVRESLSKTGLC